MSKKDTEILELEYAEPASMVVSGPEGDYRLLRNEDLTLPEPGKEDVLREIALDNLRVEAVNNADAYVASRAQEKAMPWYPISILVAFFGGAWIVGAMWLLHNNGKLGGF